MPRCSTGKSRPIHAFAVGTMPAQEQPDAETQRQEHPHVVHERLRDRERAGADADRSARSRRYPIWSLRLPSQGDATRSPIPITANAAPANVARYGDAPTMPCTNSGTIGETPSAATCESASEHQAAASIRDGATSREIAAGSTAVSRRRAACGVKSSRTKSAEHDAPRPPRPPPTRSTRRGSRARGRR